MASKKTPITIGIAGGSGSGKTTVANEILEQVGRSRISYLPHDAYYRDLSELPRNQRMEVNFDHPNSLESDLLVKHIQALKKWQPIDLPLYDFTHHRRTGNFVTIHPQPVILVEGILIFSDPTLRQMFDVKIFVDTDSDIRFIRRLQRDITERARTTENVITQYMSTVRPMHLEFVEPSKRYADVIIPEGGMNKVALEMVIARIEGLLSAHRIEAE